jgi:hypothetical protein
MLSLLSPFFCFLLWIEVHNGPSEMPLSKISSLWWILHLCTLPVLHHNLLSCCWRIKDISTYDLQAYEPTPFSPRYSLGSLSIRIARGLQAFDLLLLLTYPNPNLWLN